MFNKDIADRLIHVRKEHLGYSDQKVFAGIIGINWRTLQTYEQGTVKKMPLNYFDLLNKQFYVSREWIMTGEGEMLESDQPKNESIAPGINSQMIKAPIMSVKASAGTGREQYEVVTTGELLIDRMLFKVLPNLKNIRAIEVEGDSMYPTLKEGDYVVIEENMHFSGDGIYVLQYDGVLLVKRLQADIDGIEILSDNQSYKTRKFDPNEDQQLFHIMGKVILRMQR